MSECVVAIAVHRLGRFFLRVWLHTHRTHAYGADGTYAEALRERLCACITKPHNARDDVMRRDAQLNRPTATSSFVFFVCILRMYCQTRVYLSHTRLP